MATMNIKKHPEGFDLIIVESADLILPTAEQYADLYGPYDDTYEKWYSETTTYKGNPCIIFSSSRSNLCRTEAIITLDNLKEEPSSIKTVEESEPHGK